MSKSGTLVLGAVAGSAAIVALAWTLGGPAELTTEDDLAAPQFATPDGLLAPSPDGGNPVRRVARAEFRSELEDGRVQVFSFAGVEPRSNVVFVSDFTEPRAELYLTGGRLVTIAAASGTFQHPGNVPTSGRFDSDVVVTLYEAENDALLDVDDAAQIVFRLYLDETTDFDRDLGRIVTEGPVHLTGPAASFRGRGLRLTYSADDERIAELIVEQGDELRLRRDAEDQVATVDEAEAPTVEETDSQPPRGNAAAQSEPGTEVPQPLEPLQYYRARFDEDVLVRVGPDDEARLTGDTLDLAFAFVEGKEGPALTQTDRPRHDTRLASAETTEETTQTDAAPVLPPFPDASSVEEAWDGLAMGGWGGRELFTPRDDDVRITWAGPLTLYPLDGPPPMLRSGDNQAFPDPDAALLTLAGTPALVEVANPDRPGAPTTVAADALAYATGTGRLEARGTPDRPFRMHALDQGTLTGQRLDFRPNAPEFQADIAGPGRLAAAAKGPTGAANASATAALNVQFAQRMRLAFLDDASTDASRDESQSPLDDLGRLAAADFAGQVHAIAVDPSEPDEPPLDLTAEMLRVDFERDAALASDDDTPTLRRLHAQRGVLAQYADRSLAADDLVADFTTEPLDDTGEANTRLARLTATGNATALLLDDEEEGEDQDQPSAAPNASATTLTAHQIVATPDAGDLKLGRESGTLLLIADPADPNAPPARITTPTAVLTGPRLLLNEAEQSLQAQGPGRLTQTEGDESLAIVFATSLDYRGDAQPFPTADAVGDVRAQRGTPIQASRVQAHRLALTFFPTADPSAEEPSDKATDQANTNAAPLPTLQLRTAHATADPDDPATPVELAAQTHPLGQPDDPLTRLTVLGPEVWLTQAPTGDLPPHAQVTGQGQLRLEDYTEPADVGEPDEANDDEAAADLQLAGQGVTLFRWTDRLYVDLTTNDLTMYGRVGMNHNPLDGQPNILLLADRLRADLTEDPPFTHVLAADPDAEQGDTAAEPALRQVQLDGSVIVQQETRRVFADQLLFTADDRDVLLQAYPGGTVRAEDTADDRATFEADAFEWNLDRDRLKITDYRGGLVPIE